MNRARSAVAALSGAGAVCCALIGEGVPPIIFAKTKTPSAPATILMRSGDAFLKENMACIPGLSCPVDHSLADAREAPLIGCSF